MTMPYGPSGSNLCFNTSGYYCTTLDGRDFDLRVTNLPTTGLGNPYTTNGGFEIQNGRVVISGDYEVDEHWMAGARIGIAFQRYPGTLAPDQAWSPGRFHFEARFTHLFGEGTAPQPRGFMPRAYLLFAVGAAQYDGKEDVGGGTRPRAQAWKVFGPVFTTVGVGLRWMIGPDAAIGLAPAKISLVLPNEAVIAWTPEVSLQVGFSR